MRENTIDNGAANTFDKFLINIEGHVSGPQAECTFNLVIIDATTLQSNKYY